MPLDPYYPKERLAFMLRDTRAAVLLTQERLTEHRKLKPVLSQAEGIEGSDCPFSILDPEVKVVCLDKDWKEIGREPQENPRNEATAENLAYVVYTSGSAGEPKGVEVPHRGITRLTIRH